MNDKKAINTVKVTCDNCSIDYYYEQPSKSSIVIKGLGSRIIADTYTTTSVYPAEAQLTEGIIYCPQCKNYYRFNYLVDPKKLEPLAGQWYHVKRESDVLQPWEEEWFKYWRDSIKDSPVTINETAKYIIGIISGIIAIYTGGLALIGITKTTGTYLFDLLLLLPIASWLAAIIMCVRAYSPDVYAARSDSIISIKNAYQDISQYKYAKLKIAVLFFIIGITIAASLLIIGPGIAPGILNEKPHKVQFIVTNNSSQMQLEQMFIPMVPDTHRTIEVTLKSVGDDIYTIGIGNKSVKFKKDLVDGIIYWD